jgi:hypothetical protein
MCTYATENKNNQIKSKRELADLWESRRADVARIYTNRKRAILQSRLGSCYYYEGRKYIKKTQVYKNILSTAGAITTTAFFFSRPGESSYRWVRDNVNWGNQRQMRPSLPRHFDIRRRRRRMDEDSVNFQLFLFFVFCPGKCTERNRRRTKRQIYSQPRRTYLIHRRGRRASYIYKD